MTAGMVGTAIVFFPAAPLLLFVHGKDISIPEGTEVTAFVSGDMKLDMSKFSPEVPPVPESASTEAAPSAAAIQLTAVTIDSNVPNCEIEVDGNFAGSTPSTVSLAPGKHVILVKKAGYQDWTRNLSSVGGTIRVSAEMVSAK